MRLEVGPRVTWVRIGGKTTHLKFARVVRRVLAALLRQQRTRRGQGLSIHELTELAWRHRDAPYDKLVSRTYAAIYRLRKVLPQDALPHVNGKYLLDPSLEVVNRSDSDVNSE